MAFGALAAFAFMAAAAPAQAQAVDLSTTGDTLCIDLDNAHTPGQIVLDFTPAVPEPGTWALFGAGLLALAQRMRRPRPARPAPT